MREELMKKFAEDDRLEQISEHKRRMKARCIQFIRCGGTDGGTNWFKTTLLKVNGFIFLVEYVFLIHFCAGQELSQRGAC